MSGHLTSDELARWIAGERENAAASHLRECAACGGEVRRMEAALAEFRGAVESWVAPAVCMRPSRRRSPVVRWALAAALAVVLAAAPVEWRRERAAERAREDAALLEQVDAEVSEAVPEAMAPLVQLVSWQNGDKQQ